MASNRLHTYSCAEYVFMIAKLAVAALQQQNPGGERAKPAPTHWHNGTPAIRPGRPVNADRTVPIGQRLVSMNRGVSAAPGPRLRSRIALGCE
jgi:hypothetical protein